MRADRFMVWPLWCVLFLLLVPWECAGYTTGEVCGSRESLCRALRERGFTGEELDRTFSDPRVALYPEILEKKGKGLDYFSKKFGLLSRRSVERGRDLLARNRTVLTDLGRTYHVPPEIMVALFRVETNFGQYVGTYPVFNSLLTMTLIENTRSDWAEKELIHLLVLSRQTGADPLEIKGSWAGAFGLCQFIPSSYRDYGVDGDGDGVVDLFRFTDAMASIANYLAAHGWKSGDTGRMRRAIYAYNHCDNYVKAVLAYARAIKNPPARTTKKHSRKTGKKGP